MMADTFLVSAIILCYEELSDCKKLVMSGVKRLNGMKKWAMKLKRRHREEMLKEAEKYFDKMFQKPRHM